MKLFVTLSWAAGLLALAAGCNNSSPAGHNGIPQPDLNDAHQRLSYGIGVDLGSTLKRQEIDVDAAALAAGIADSLAGKPALTEDEVKETLRQFRQHLMDKAHTRANVGAKTGAAPTAESNREQGEAFLKANAAKPGVVTLPSGLQYKVLKSGTGRTPQATDKVKVHYHGTLVDGTVFDSSIDRGQPVSFAVNQVIAGWQEALPLMKEGDKWQLVIPAKLAYGEGGAGGKIGPNATLIFDVELLEVETPAKQEGN